MVRSKGSWLVCYCIVLGAIRATVASLDQDDIPDQGTTARRFLDDLDAWLVPRQTATQAPQPAPAQGTPGPPVPVSWPADSPIVISIISDSSTPASAPTPSANGNGNTTSSNSPSSSSPPSSTLTTSSQSISASASASTTTTPKPVPSIRLSLFTFVPAIGGLGLLLLLVVAWLIYGCVTRKPKKSIHGRMFDLDRDGEELVCGPPYSTFLNHGNGHNGNEQNFEYRLEDLEREGRRGYGLGLKEYPKDDRDDEEEYLFRPPKKMTRHVSHWPSFTSPPTFNPTTGLHLPRQYSHDGEGAEDNIPLMAVPPALSHSRAGTSKTRSTAPTKSRSRSQASRSSRTPQRPAWKSNHSSSSTATNTTITGPPKSKSSHTHPHPRPPPPSHHPSTNTFSTQLYSDSDSDDHKEFHDQARDQSALLTAPWESLRHKSIKRGILEQLRKGKEKEAKWMDSIRSGGQFLATLGGSIRGSGSGSRRGVVDEEAIETLFDDPESEEPAETYEPGTRKRRGHVRADSDVVIPSRPPSALTNASSSRSPTKKDTQPLNISKSGSRPKSRARGNSTPARPGFGRRGFSWLKGDAHEGSNGGGRGEEEEEFELLPTPFSEQRMMDWSGVDGRRSAGSSPVKAGNQTASKSSSRAKSRARANTTGSSTSVADGGGHRMGMKALPATPSRHVLPEGPSQLMSPPLESQMCFTPIGLSVSQMPVDHNSTVPGGASAPVPTRMGTPKSHSKSRSRSHSRPGDDEADYLLPETQTPSKTKLPMPSRRLRFPVTQAPVTLPTAAEDEDYVEVGAFAPFRTPTPSPKKLQKANGKEGRSRSKSSSREGGEASFGKGVSTPVKERESFWTPRRKRDDERGG